MKKLYFLIVIVLLFVSGNAQIVNFPDANFKAKLLLASPSNTIAKIHSSGTAIYAKIDTNNNGEIEVSEAALIYILDVSNSNISSLNGIEYFTGLEGLHCQNNQLTSLTYSSNFQFELDCSNNQLTAFDFSGFHYALFLNCKNNQITSFDFTQMQVALSLECSNNPLTSLICGDYHKLIGLTISNTAASIIDISGNYGCESLNCMNNNNLNALIIKDAVDIDADQGDMWGYFNFGSNPNLQYLCVSESRLSQAQLKLNTYGYTNCALNSYCDFNPGAPFYTVQGTNTFDSDGNGCDVNDPPFPNLRIGITNGVVSGTIPTVSGNYTVAVLSGTHTITPILENTGYFVSNPSSLTVNFPTQSSPLNQNFCISANGNHPDFEITLLPLGSARPGFIANYKIIIKNKGTISQSGSIQLAYDDSVINFATSNPSISSQSTGLLVFNFNTMHPLEESEILLSFTINGPTDIPAVNLGDVLTYTVSVISATTDETPENNISALHQIVRNSIDPNDKTCIEGATITSEMIGKEVHYMIRFENSGTANAKNIVVKDIIDTAKFDINSLIPISGSHPFVTKISNTNKVEFIFENINLPFTTGSNDGYVAFKIKTKPTLVVGDTFSNSANIYFDYNFPILTNTATTTITALATQDFAFESYFKIYPNPAKDILNIETKKTIEVTSINIYNTLGQVVLVIPNAQQTKSVDVSSLKTGNYFIKVNSDKGSSNTKFVKL